MNNLNDDDYIVWKEVYQIIKDVEPDIIGLSVKTPSVGSALKVSRIAKTINPNMLVVWGGPHPSMVPENVIKENDVDLVVVGEGEKTLLNYLEKMDTDEWENIQGIVYKKKNRIINNGVSPTVLDLDSIPFPNKYFDKVTINSEKYPKPSTIFSSRGCPYQCVYCGSRNIFGQKIRFRSVDNVMEEIKYLHDNFGTRYFTFDDDTFGVNEKITHDICNRIIESKMKITWECETRANLINHDIVKLLSKAGCTRTWLGIESGNQDILKLIKKGITLNQIHNAFSILKQNNMIIQAFFMIGFPWDTEHTIKNTIDLMMEIKPDIAVLSVFTPYPGTEIFNYCEKEGLISKGIDWNSYYHESKDVCFVKDIPRSDFRKIALDAIRLFDRHNRKYKLRLIRKHPKILYESIKKQNLLKLSNLPLLIKKSISYISSLF